MADKCKHGEPWDDSCPCCYAHGVLKLNGDTTAIELQRCIRGYEMIHQLSDEVTTTHDHFALIWRMRGIAEDMLNEEKRRGPGVVPSVQEERRTDADVEEGLE